MGVHEELAGLLDAVGPGVFDDAESFRAAMDDFLGDDMATRGELNLLVDVVRLGAHTRLADQVGNGARPGDAVDVVGDQLARDRGTTESGSARWAVAAMGFAVGLVGEEVVAARRAVMSPPPEPSAAPPAPEERPAAGGHGSTASRPALRGAPATVTAPSAPPPPTGTPDPEPGGRRGRVLAAVAVVVVLLAGAGVALRTVSDGDRDPGGAVDEPSRATGPFAPVAVSGGRSRENGVRMERTYRLSAEGITSAVELTNVTKRKVTWLGAEVVPKELADHISKVTFRPRYQGVIEADPIVYWRITIEPGETRRIRWTTGVPEEAVPSEELVGRVVGWHEEAITKETPRVRRELAKLAQKGDAVDDPDTPDPPAFVTKGPTTGLPTALPPVTREPPRDDGDGGNGGDDGDSGRRTPANRAPDVALGARTDSEREWVSFGLRTSDPDGDEVSVVQVSGLPAGVGRSGSTLRGTISHAAASATTSKTNIRSVTRTVSVTVRDEHGKQTTRSFSWTVRDTHLLMPNYVNTPGTNQHLKVNGSARSHCYDPRLQRGSSIIIGQSVRAGTVISYGAAVRYDWAHNVAEFENHPSC